MKSEVQQIKRKKKLRRDRRKKEKGGPAGSMRKDRSMRRHKNEQSTRQNILVSILGIPSLQMV